MMTYFEGDTKIIALPGESRIGTQEGKAAYLEAVDFLKKQKGGLQSLKRMKGLDAACKQHCEDIGPKGIGGHQGSDGTQPGERFNQHGKWLRGCAENISFGSRSAKAALISWIIDDGVPSRGHRTNLFKPEMDCFGSWDYTHKVYGCSVTMGFANGYTNK